jgi:hypothetical protein
VDKALEPDFGPIEDLIKQIFERYFATVPNVHVYTEFSEGMQMPAVIGRADRRSGITAFHSTTDDRFLKPAVIAVSAFADGINADEEASQLAEACRLALRRAQMEQWVIPGIGHISVVDNSTPATRTTDWATSTAVVQYASLPKGAARYEGIYRLLVRPPVGGTNNPFLPH